MSSKRSRRSRKRQRPTKARKPKFMSLNDRHLGPMQELAHDPAETQPMDDNDSPVACLLLEEGAEPDGRATITDLFGSSTSSSSVVVDEVLSPAASPSVEWYGDRLARRALRGRERWVFCRSEVAEEAAAVPQGLQLKLDYDEVLTAWSDRGSLYIDGDGPPQVVPELGQQQQAHGQGCCFDDDFIAPTAFVGVGNCSGLGVVPEMEVEEQKLNREERVMRYKAKRQTRLFSKRIRYEVRKLNAEKRPRIKGRFVKRIDDV